ncbi:MAG: hypothetical protein CM15mV94_150 [uncultured marine virus]|nr:MAG: hypothetical protein CM15mV94_150 [uncultured marine virus]
MEGTFYGTIVRHIIPEKLPNLTSFNCGRGGGAYFHPDNVSSLLLSRHTINGDSVIIFQIMILEVLQIQALQEMQLIQMILIPLKVHQFN